MSWWIRLVNNTEKVIETDVIRQEGGTQVVGGHKMAELNVTYNYAIHFDFKQLNGLTAQQGHTILKMVYDTLIDDVDRSDYWNPTEGNVKRAIKTLMEFAKYAIEHNIENARFLVH